MTDIVDSLEACGCCRSDEAAVEIRRLRDCLRRLASSEAFDLPQALDGPLAEELKQRMDYAFQSIQQPSPDKPR